MRLQRGAAPSLAPPLVCRAPPQRVARRPRPAAAAWQEAFQLAFDPWNAPQTALSNAIEWGVAGGVVAGAAALFLRSAAAAAPPPGLLEGERGAAFEAPEGAEPELDRRGEVVLRCVGYTPYPCEVGAAGERVQAAVGKVGATAPRTFAFERLLPPPSRLVVCTLPRPLGVAFEEDARRGRAVVAELAPGGSAAAAARRAALGPGAAAAAAPATGDVLRAVTSTTLVYRGANALLGTSRPERTVVLYGADRQRWPEVAAALKRGLAADGEATLVLERRVLEEQQ
jgi:hypothetical protein